jgi:hypothetical protein
VGYLEKRKLEQFEQALDIDQLGSFSRRFALTIFADFPDFEKYAMMAMQSEPDGFSLLVEIPSPVLKETRNLHIWVDESMTPSIGFGPDHTHGNADEAGIQEILSLTHAVVSDRLVIAKDVGGDHDGHCAWLDLGQPLSLLSKLTSPYSPGTIEILSFSGAADRTVGLSDLAE